MKKLTGKCAAVLMLLGAVAGVGVATGTTTAHAKTITSYPWKYGLKKNYNWTQPNDAAPMYYTNTKKNAYIWNKKFTKKTHNLKNYPYHTWYVQKSFKRNGKVYYKVYGGKKLSGYVWRGYVTPAIAKQISSFNTDNSYIKYLKTDTSQKLSRAVLKYFPNAEISLDLSRRAAGQIVNGKSMTTSNYKHVINLTALSMVTHDSFGKSYVNVHSALEDPVITSNADKAKNVNRILVKNGYTQSKIKSLISQGYKLGIYINDNAGFSASKQGYPWTIETHSDAFDSYAIYLAK